LLAARIERFLASLADTWLIVFRSLISSATLPPVSAYVRYILFTSLSEGRFSLAFTFHWR
jgi:hypothetical protein